jgi:hypothetical protein
LHPALCVCATVSGGKLCIAFCSCRLSLRQTSQLISYLHYHAFHTYTYYFIPPPTCFVRPPETLDGMKTITEQLEALAFQLRTSQLLVRVSSENARSSVSPARCRRHAQYVRALIESQASARPRSWTSPAALSGPARRYCRATRNSTSGGGEEAGLIQWFGVVGLRAEGSGVDTMIAV